MNALRRTEVWLWVKSGKNLVHFTRSIKNCSWTNRVLRSTLGWTNHSSKPYYRKYLDTSWSKLLFLLLVLFPSCFIFIKTVFLNSNDITLFPQNNSIFWLPSWYCTARKMLQVHWLRCTFIKFCCIVSGTFKKVLYKIKLIWIHG